MTIKKESPYKTKGISQEEADMLFSMDQVFEAVGRAKTCILLGGVTGEEVIHWERACEEVGRELVKMKDRQVKMIKDGRKSQPKHIESIVHIKSKT